VKGYTKLKRRCGRTCAARTRGSPPETALEYFQKSGSTRSSSRTVAGAISRDDEGSSRERAERTTGVHRRSATSRRTLYAATGPAGRAVVFFLARVKGRSRRCTTAVSSDPTSSLQPHPPRGTIRADAVVQAARRHQEILPVDAGRSAALHGLHGTGQTRSTRFASSVLATHQESCDTSSTECHVDGFRSISRRRVAREFYESTAYRVLRQDSQDPVLSPGEADGSTGVGTRLNKGRELYGCSGRSFGTGCIATRDARLLATEANTAQFASRSPDRATLSGRRALRRCVDKTHHAHDVQAGDLVSYNEGKHPPQRGERERAQGRHRRQPLGN